MKINKIFFLITAFIFACFHTSEAADLDSLDLTEAEKQWLRNSPVLTVGMDHSFAPFEYVTDKDEYKGAGADYFYLIAKKTGLKFKLQTGISWQETIARAQRGEIDILPCVGITKERSGYLTFSKPYLEFPRAVFTRISEEKITMGNLVQKRVGVQKNSSHSGYLHEFTSIQPIEYDTFQEAMVALSAGDLDAVIGNLAVGVYAIGYQSLMNIKVAGHIGNSTFPLAMGVSKKNQILTGIINKTLDSLTYTEQMTIKRRWFSKDSNTTDWNLIFELSGDETKWIRDHKNITIAFDADYAPYSWKNAQGEFVGIAVDFFKEIAEKTGLKYNIYPNGVWKDLYTAALDKKVDVIATLAYRKERIKHFNYTKPYLSLAQYIITAKDNQDIQDKNDISGKTVALVKGYSTSRFLLEEYPDIKPLYVNTVSEAVIAVSNGKVEATVVGMGTAQHVIAHSGITNLRFAALYAQGLSKQAYGIRKDWPELASILEKTLASLTEQQRLNIFQKWSKPEIAKVEVVPPEPFNITLSNMEKTWLHKKGKIKIGIMDKWAPMNFINENGEPDGIGVDLIKAMNEKLSGNLVIVPGAFKDNMQAVKDHHLDAIMDITPKPEREAFFNFTKPYLIIPHIIVGRETDDFFENENALLHKTVALEKGFYTIKLLKKEFPEINIKEYTNTSECLKAVLTGEADAYIGNRAVVLHHIKTELISGLRLMGQTSKPPVKLNIGVRKDLPQLAVILDKIMDSIPQSQKNTIQEKWIGEIIRPHTSIDLNDKEKEWLANNQTINLAYNKLKPPFEWQDNKGVYRGISSDYIKEIEFITGLKIEIKGAFSGSEILEKLKTGQIDITTAVTASENRKEYLNFTNPYISYQGVIAIRNNSRKPNSLRDFYGKKVGVGKNYIYHEYISQNFPGIILKPYDYPEKGLADLAVGNIEAYVGNLGVITYIVNQQNLINIKVSGSVKGLENPQQCIGVRKDLKTLTSILNKALEEIPQSRKTYIAQKWVGMEMKKLNQKAVPAESININKKKSSYSTFLQIIIITFVFCVIAYLLVRLLKNAQTDPSKYQFDSPQLTKRIIIFNAMLVALIVAITWIVLENIKQRTRDSIKDSLYTVMKVSMNATEYWADEHINEIKRLASDPELIKHVEQQITHYRNNDDLLETESLKWMRQYFNNKIDIFGKLGFFIITPDQVSIASMRNVNIGKKNLIAEQKPGLFNHVLAGNAMLIPSIISDVKLPGSEQIGNTTMPPTMFFAAPLRNQQGRVIAILTQRLSPHSAFNRIGQLGRIGKTGETYIFDNQGHLLSESRFEDQLIKLGILPAHSQSILTVSVRDPGRDLRKTGPLKVPQHELPLTFMAQNAVQGKSGYNVIGYRDYRGIPVAGVWTWNHKLNLGMTTEIDIHEAYTAFRRTRIMLIIVLAVTAMLALGFTCFNFYLGNKATKALKATNDRLEINVAERTSELLKAKEDAESANTAKSSFLANMSHEIRTPMNAILGYSQLMQRDKTLSREHKTNLATINRSGEHLLDLINDILEMSKIESGHVELVEECFDLHQLLNDMEMMFRVRTSAKNIQLEFSKSSTIPQYIISDESKIRQVLINLLGNAVKFTSEGKISVLITQKRDRTDNLILMFTVTDTGPGISPKDQAKIFGAFEQTEAGQLTEGGTGLGLAISKKYALMMSGDIKVTSSLGMGSSFRFSIKTTEGDSNKLAPKLDNRRVVALQPGQKKYKILVVDDRETNRDILLKMLKEVGFFIKEACNGQEGLMLYKEWRPDIIMMDIRMPVMNGVDAIKAIRKEPGGEAVIIFAVSASALDTQRHEVLQYGMANDFIPKPFKESLIFAEINKYLGIEFIYEDETADDTVKVEQILVNNKLDLTGLPDEVINNLYEAAVNVDLSTMLEILNSLGDEHGETVTGLKYLVEQFEFDELQKLLHKNSSTEGEDV